MAIHHIIVQTFYLKTINVNLMVKEKVRDSPKYYYSSPDLGTMNICTKCCANPSRRCWDISLDRWKVSPAGGARGNVKGSPKPLGFILWGAWMSVPNFTVIHQIVVEIFQSGPKWWTGRQMAMAKNVRDLNYTYLEITRYTVYDT